ncbi:hypothetical protein BK004_00075 [bacterium CG10_46_32]|nr:MAG: hypothetical protein BK004_00075 [bacterium CG10_46_32]PIR56520.1 MAG: hypothetical protein COU73_00075 [Parcubacteria group bacterium CG10_big_fil_rev_8_21_14_0_10_46_32]
MNNTDTQNQTAPMKATQPATIDIVGAVPEQGATSKESKKKPKAAPKLTSFMLQWFREYYYWVTGVACFVIVVAGYVLALSPKFSQARSVSGIEFQAVHTERQKLEQTLSYVTKLGSGKTAQSARTIRDVDDFLPLGPATPQILTSLESIARESGAVIDGIELVIPEEDESKKDSDSDIVLPAGVAFVEVTLAISASPYDKLKTLLSNIESNIRLMDVIAVVYSPIGKSYTIILRAYYLSNE